MAVRLEADGQGLTNVDFVVDDQNIQGNREYALVILGIIMSIQRHGRPWISSLKDSPRRESLSMVIRGLFGSARGGGAAIMSTMGEKPSG
jgi:hypothetical protein